MSAEDKGWPVDDTPVAEKVLVAATVRGDEPVAVLTFADWTGDVREIQLTEDAAYDALDGLMKFFLTLNRKRRNILDRD